MDISPEFFILCTMTKSKIIGIAKKVLIGLLVVLVIIQFIHPEKNINTTVSALDMNVMYPIPDSVNRVLKNACYDCHSNNTRYPWYNNIQPVAWWLRSEEH